ncbi:ABC transporter permease [Williamsoniiplasma luminosum]|uniref:ABC transporter permease n=1 Tax=Williamsoniiplasma luminosum TaxID=214888 RepID=A0A2K8NV54_9MOLU|nr:ABC transporter permease [Williamsoniiplasma luminosum]ATZ17038.1 ABC transporter permease [Williamsoniiplasma luminosum]
MGKSLRLTFKNSFKNAISSKSQLIGLITLIALLSLVISLMLSISARVLVQYDALKRESNQHNLVMKIDPFEKVKTSDGAPPNIVDAQQYWLQDYNTRHNQMPKMFDWTRTEAREFTQVFFKENLITLKAVAKTTNKGLNPVDKLIISEGENLDYKKNNGLNQAVLDPGFAKTNNIEIGSIIRFQKDNLGDRFLVTNNKNSGATPEEQKDIENIAKEGLFKEDGIFLNSKYKNYNWFQIVGFGNSADFIMPILNSTLPLPNRDNQALLYVNPVNFGMSQNIKTQDWEFRPNDAKLVVTSNNEWESFYSIKAPVNFDPELANAWFNSNALENNSQAQKKLFYPIHDKSYAFVKRTSTVESTIQIYNAISGAILIVILIVSIYTMALVTRKQIDKSRAQIGIMKALGYRKRDIILNFTVLPFITSLMGGALGYLIAQGIQVALIQEIRLYFSINFAIWAFDWISLLILILSIWGLLNFIAFFIAYLILRGSALSLIEANKKPRIHRYTKILKRTNTKISIGAKIQNALFIDSLGKMSAVGGVVLLSTILLTAGFAAPDILNRNRTKSFEGINYNQLVEYQQPTYNNPFSFMKTYNKNAPVDFGKFNDVTIDYKGTNWKGQEEQKHTVLKTTLDVDHSKYDISKLVDKINNNNLTSDYYGVALKTKDKDHPDSQFITKGNMRMLSANDIALSTNYFRYIASLGERNSNGEFFPSMMYSMLLGQWPSYQQFKKELDASKDNKAKLKVMLNFYNFYSNSIGLTISNKYSMPKGVLDKDKIPTDEERIENFNKNNDIQKQAWNGNTQGIIGLDGFTWEQLPDNVDMFISDGKKSVGKNRIIFNLDNPIDDLATLNVDDLDSEKDKELITKYLAAIELWYVIYISNRSDTAILQATYSRSPYFVQQTLKERYEKQESYATGFNIVSYDPQTEYLGTMFEAIKDELKFKVYGIHGENQFIDLNSRDGVDLNNRLKDPTIEDNYRVVVNQSLAKKLNLHEGSVITDLSSLKESLIENNENVSTRFKVEDWKDTKIQRKDPDSLIPGGGDKIGPEGGFVQTSLLEIGWNAFAQPTNFKYQLGSAGKMSQFVKESLLNHYINGSIKNAKEKIKLDRPLKVVGIHDGYGQPTAWINNDDANTIMDYQPARDFLFDKYFKVQWGDDIKKILSKEDQSKELDTSATTIAKFISDNKSDDPKKNIDVTPIIEVFDNSHPIFNYKYSSDPGIGDLDKLVSTNTMLGDYSPIAMNGDANHDGIGRGSIAYVLPVATAKALLNQLSNVVLGVMILLILMLIAMTMIIIGLTTSIIIKDNARFIATLKVLGYTNVYICRSILGMYLAVIASMLVVGFIAGFAIFYKVVQYMTFNTSFVLPFQFVIWLPFAVIVVILVLYAITLGFGFRNISKLNATHLLQNVDL